jgi:hypothetical protein
MPISQDQHSAIVEQWMTTIIQDGGIDRYDDLHIDRIEKEWADRKSWLSGAIQAFQIALHQRDRHNAALVVAVGFSLICSHQSIGVNFATLDGLEAQLDTSPPSVYLFHAGQEPWQEKRSSTNLGDLQNLQIVVCDALVADLLPEKHCYYLEFFRQEEYRRSMFIAG